MRKITILAVLVCVLVSLVSKAGEVRRPGMAVKGWLPLIPPTVFDPHADFTGGIAPAIADSIRGGNNGVPNNMQYKKGAVTNSCGYDIFVEVSIAYLPGNIDAYQLKNQTGVRNIPGWEDWSTWIPKRGKAQFSLTELSLKPGSWDVRVYKRSGDGKKLIKNTFLIVDVLGGRNIRNGVVYDFVFDF